MCSCISSLERCGWWPAIVTTVIKGLTPQRLMWPRIEQQSAFVRFGLPFSQAGSDQGRDHESAEVLLEPLVSAYVAADAYGEHIAEPSRDMFSQKPFSNRLRNHSNELISVASTCR